MSSTRQQPPDAGLIDNMTLGVVQKPIHEAIWAAIIYCIPVQPIGMAAI